MKIGLVLDDTLDTPDGVQQYVLSMGNWLIQRGHEVHYLVGATKRTDVPNLHSLSRNFHVRFNGNHLSIPLPASRRRLKQLLHTHQFDVLHVQVPYSPFLAGRLIHLAPASTAVVGTFHVLPYGRFELLANHLLAVINRRTARQFQAMIAASEPAASFAHDCYGFETVVIPHMIDYKKFAITVPSDDNVNIVYMARLVDRKGAQWFLKALVALQKQNPLPTNVRVQIGGRGPLAAQLESYVKSEGLADIVEFCGFIAEADKAKFLAQADIAVFPSVSGESFGISIIEALAAARGVVLAGDNPGYRAAMPAASEQLHDPTNVTDYASKLGYWLAHPEARTIAANHQKAYARQFDTASICSRVEEVYEQALQRRVKS